MRHNEKLYPAIYSPVGFENEMPKFFHVSRGSFILSYIFVDIILVYLLHLILLGDKSKITGCLYLPQ